MGRPLGKGPGVVPLVGLAMILMLMVLAFSNDIRRRSGGIWAPRAAGGRFQVAAVARSDGGLSMAREDCSPSEPDT